MSRISAGTHLEFARWQPIALGRGYLSRTQDIRCGKSRVQTSRSDQRLYLRVYGYNQLEVIRLDNPHCSTVSAESVAELSPQLLAYIQKDLSDLTLTLHIQYYRSTSIALLTRLRLQRDRAQNVHIQVLRCFVERVGRAEKLVWLVTGGTDKVRHVEH